MYRHRGFTIIQLGLVLAILLAIGGIAFTVKGYLEDIRQQGYDAGYAAAEKEGQQKLAEQKQDFETAIAEQKKEAARQLAAAQREKEDREKQLQSDKDELERKYGDAQNRINEQVRVARNLIDAVGGLRDPGTRSDNGCGPSGNSTASGNTTSSGSNTGHERGVRLSRAAEDFLLAQAADANKVVARMQICREWASKVSKATAGR